MGMPDRIRELWDCMDASDVALGKLYEARDCLITARRWGAADAVGGMLFVGLMKRRKIRQAARDFFEAKQAMTLFAEYLDGIDQIAQVDISSGTVIAGMDLAVDNIFSDMRTLRHLEEAQGSVESCIFQVEQAQVRIRGHLHT